ncbi:response regulator [Geodermatophilus sp. URMC 64]
MIKILLVDDHDFVREALGDLFALTPDIRVVGECADGSEALPTVLRTDPDVVLMDAAMPGMTGLEATRTVLAVRPATRVVMHTATVTVASVCAAREVGVSGYVVKGGDPGELPSVVRAVAAGSSFWCTAAAARLPGCGRTREPSPLPTPSA